MHCCKPGSQNVHRKDGQGNLEQLRIVSASAVLPSRNQCASAPSDAYNVNPGISLHQRPSKQRVKLNNSSCRVINRSNCFKLSWVITNEGNKPKFPGKLPLTSKGSSLPLHSCIKPLMKKKQNPKNPRKPTKNKGNQPSKKSKKTSLLSLSKPHFSDQRTKSPKNESPNA